jgi:hypothetical protein
MNVVGGYMVTGRMLKMFRRTRTPVPGGSPPAEVAGGPGAPGVRGAGAPGVRGPGGPA